MPEQPTPRIFVNGTRRAPLNPGSVVLHESKMFTENRKYYVDVVQQNAGIGIRLSEIFGSYKNRFFIPEQYMDDYIRLLVDARTALIELKKEKEENSEKKEDAGESS